MAWRKATAAPRRGMGGNRTIVPQLSLQPIRVVGDVDGADTANGQAGGLGEAIAANSQGWWA